MVMMGMNFSNLENLSKGLPPGYSVVIYPDGEGYAVYGDPQDTKVRFRRELLLDLLAGAKVLWGDGAKIFPPLEQ